MLFSRALVLITGLVAVTPLGVLAHKGQVHKNRVDEQAVTPRTTNNCLSGSYKSNGRCVPCPAGYKCPANCPQPDKCPANTYSDGGDAVCTPCPSGTISDPGSERCTPKCSAGNYLSNGSCKACSAGSYSSAGATSCNSCPANTFSISNGASSCQPCPSRSSSPPGSTTCTTINCPAGKYYSNGACASCPAGTFSGPNASSCSQCPADTFSSGGSASCTACTGGSTCTPGSSSCTPRCGDGKIFTSGRCQNCPAGSYSNNNMCSDCPAGSISAPGSGTCNQCPGGSVPASNKMSCSTCPRNTFSSGDDCSPCPAGATSNPGSSTCGPQPSMRSLSPRQPKPCPRGQTRCEVRGGMGGWDCLDIMTSPETCGSCDNDCSNMEGTDGGVSCVEGHCHALSCKAGYWLVDGHCVDPSLGL